ncbi:hypothetical protein G4B88_021011 [Cannabis sativa]|uniref:Aldehyde dehydrogenase domain-containing protein n=1 Tax=Cannabis sativa TaxID=3483 RepID=A0A7J6GAM3_CANSA|nr:hypothetical protein G4B88_021011 [Cannabis sativa]
MVLLPDWDFKKQAHLWRKKKACFEDSDPDATVMEITFGDRERSRFLLHFADLIKNHNEEISSLKSWNNGKPFEQAAKAEIQYWRACHATMLLRLIEELGRINPWTN